MQGRKGIAMKTLYVHIGTPKTGTKAIQHFCMDNNEVLGKYGFCYPDLSAITPEVIREKNGRFLVEEFKDEDQAVCRQKEREKYREGMDVIERLFLQYDNVILSDEGIYRWTYKRRKKLWAELKEDGDRCGFTPKVILYLRRQDEFLSSLWKQNIKMSVPPACDWTWERYIANIPARRQINYYEKIKSIADVLGKENVIVRRYDRERFYGGSIYHDFMNAVGLTLSDEYTIVQGERNKSFDGNTHEFMRIANGVSQFNDADRAFIRKILYANCENSKEFRYSMFSKKENKQFLNKLKSSNRLVAAEYLGEPDRDLFDLTIADLPKWTPDNSYMMEDLIRFTAIGMSFLKQENRKFQEKCDHMQRQIDEMKALLKEKENKEE